MRTYIFRRLIYMIFLLLLTSVVAFIVITLPPGDYLTSYIAQLKAQGAEINEDQIASLERQYGLGEPTYVQYFKWMSRMLQGDLGMSFAWGRPVSELIWERLGMTILVSIGALILTYLIAIPIGIFSAVKQYSVGDYFFTFVAFIGVSIPEFLLALVLMMFFYRYFGISVGGLFSPEFIDTPWSLLKVIDLIEHLPIPLLAIGLTGTAWLIRTMRAMLLDELRKPYVETARAKGLAEWTLLRRYPIRIALIPIASTAGWALPQVFSGSVIVSIVLNLPTIGPLLFSALMTEDMFLAASTVLIISALTLIGTFLSDILIAWLDPRIQYS